MQGQQLQNQRSAMELGLLDQLLSAEGPEDQGRLIAQLRALRGGSNEQNRYTIVPGGQEVTDQGMRTVPSRVFNNQTGQFVEHAGQQAPVRNINDIGQDPSAAAIKENKSMTRQQKIDALIALGYA